MPEQKRIDKELLGRFYRTVQIYQLHESTYKTAITTALENFNKTERAEIERYMVMRLKEVDPGHWS